MSTSYLNNKSYPRGFRNNNPGNLIQTSIKWQGKIVPHEDETRFEQFSSFEYGLRALMLDLINDIGKKGLDTPYKLINEFAPSFENNTTAYINQISKALGISSEEKIPLDKNSLRKLVHAIVMHENGLPSTDDQFEKAYSMLPTAVKEVIKSQPEKKPAGPFILSSLAIGTLVTTLF